MPETPKYVDCMIISGGRKLAGRYTYALPDEWAKDVRRGDILLVPARKKLRMAVALEFPESTDIEGIKNAVARYDGPPIISEKQIAAAEWMQRYYVVPPVPALKPFLLELQALKAVEYMRPALVKQFMDRLSEMGFLFIRQESADLIAEGKPFRRRKLENILAESGFEQEAIDEAIDKLLKEGILRIDFSIEKKREVSRADSYIKLLEGKPGDAKLTEKQKQIVDFIGGMDGPVLKSSITDAYPKSGQTITSLKKKGIIVEFSDASMSYAPAVAQMHELTEHQQNALAQIVERIEKKEAATILLHGVTGSGKTEVYVHAARKAVDAGRQVVVLVPEIALTHQVVRRFARDFPGRLAILHSELSKAQRVSEWEKIRNRQADIVIGARSALFAPLEDIGLIILDEEHEPSYKQNSMPRYHARELARRLVELHSATLVLGSATPSMESYELAMRGKFHLIELPERILGGPLPEIELVKRQFVRKRLPDGKTVRRLEVITETLRAAMEDVLSRGKQALLFLNMRGYAKTLICPGCGHSFECPDCLLPLVYHQKTGALMCHHCGYKRMAPKMCPACGDSELITEGIGTQRLEEEIADMFPGTPLHRLDRDVSDALGSSRTVLEDFRTGKSHILLGTQMIAKGLDFADVEVVGVISAEDSLAIPDFRAAERTFQLLTQVAGRAGRREARGRVIVQGMRLTHYAVTCAVGHDYKAFFTQEREIRGRFGYPPFKHLARIVIAAKEYNRAAMSADILGDALRAIGKKIPQVEILGPAPAQVEKLRGLWRRHLIFRSEKVGPISRLLRTGLSEVRFPSEVRVEIDVDPIQMI